MNPKAPSQAMQLRLNPSLWGQIANFCDHKTGARLACVNDDTRNCTTEDEHYRTIFKLHFPHYLEKKQALVQEIKTDQRVTRNQFLIAEEMDYVCLDKSVKKLFRLVKNGSLAEVKKIIKSYKDATFYAGFNADSHHLTLCYWAKRNNHQEINNYIYELIKEKFKIGFMKKNFLQDNRDLDVKKIDPNYQTLLSWAIICFQSNDVLENLIRLGANINHSFLRLGLEMTLIKLAVLVGNYDAFVFLYNHPGIQFINEDLFWDAAKYGHLDIVKYLVEVKKVIPSFQVMEEAVEGKNIPVIAYLLDTHSELLTDEILKKAEDKEVIEYLSERKCPKYKIAKEELLKEIEKLPAGSPLHMPAITFLSGVITCVKKTSEAEIKLLAATLDQTTLLLHHFNQQNIKHEDIDDYLTQANAYKINLPSAILQNILTVFTFLLYFSFSFASLAGLAVAALIIGSAAILSALATDRATRSYEQKINADPRNRNSELYETLFTYMKKIGETSQSALQNQSLFANKPSTQVAPSPPPELKITVVPTT